MMAKRNFKKFLLVILSFCFAMAANAAEQPEYALQPGDIVKISVFQNPDLSIETTIAENGTISYPLLGTVQLGGLSIPDAEKLIATQLQKGDFVVQPHVNILLTTAHGNQVAVLGQVNHPGRFPVESDNVRVSDMLALAGGVAPTGADNAVVTGTRNGKPFRKEIDVGALFLAKSQDDNLKVLGGDVIYVHRAPVYYIYGEVQKPGSYRIERNMAVIQALAQAGGLTPRGTQSGLKIVRHGKDGATEEIHPGMMDRVQTDDVLYVRESLF